MANLGNEFLNVFTSFGDVFSSSLGFKAAGAKKSEVGDYFRNVKVNVEGTRDKLNKIVENMEKEGNSNASAVKTKVEALINDKLSKIIEGAGIASKAIGDAGDPIGNVAPGNTDKAGVVGTGVEDLVKGIGKIVEVVLKERNAEAGDVKGLVKDDSNAGDARTHNGDNAGMLFASDQAGAADTNAAKAAKDAYKAVGAVTGADILKAISSDKAVALAKNTGDKSNVNAA